MERVTFVDMLEGARRRRGLSQIRAAAELKTSPTTYRQWLRGQKPDWDRLETLIDFIGEPEEDVLKAIRRHPDRNTPEGVLLRSLAPAAA